MTKIRYSGKESRERASVKRGVLLRWLWRWTFTDTYVAGELWGTAKTSTYNTIRSMIEMGLIARARVAGMPAHIIHLTPEGAKLIAPTLANTKDEDMKPLVYASRLNVRQAQHDLLAQRLVLDIKKNDKITVINDRQARHRDINIFERGKKIPDVIIFHPQTKQRWAIEIVETLPPPDERRRMLWLHAEAAAKEKLHGTVYASSQPRNLEVLQQTANSDCGSWAYNSQQRQWYEDINWGGTRHVTDDYVRTRFRTIDLSKHATTLYQVLVK